MISKKAIAVACAGMFSMGGAFAAFSFSQALIPGINQVSDDDAEVVLKWDSGLGAYRLFDPRPVLAGGKADKIAKDDIMVGMVGITSFPTGAHGTSAASYTEITALYAVQVTGETPKTGADCAGGGGGSITTCTAYTFGAAVKASALDPLNGALGLLNSIYGTTLGLIAHTTGTTIGTVMEDTTPDFARGGGGTYNAAFATASDGTQRLVLDVVSGNGDYFDATAPANPLEIATVPFGANAGSLGAKTTISYQNVPGWLIAPTLTITGNIYQPTSGPFGIWTDSTYTFQATPVPEPATLALVGLALAGIGVAGGRKTRRGA